MGDRNERYSASYQDVDTAQLSTAVRSALDELEAITGASARAVHWNDSWIAVPLELQIDLPTRGPVRGIDIRATEPVLILFHRRHYPAIAPAARSDRKDFPADRLPHLNPVGPGQPPSLCLHRGSFDDWFDEHSLREFVKRVRGWFQRAATNRLIPEGDVFEPTRLADQNWTIVFDPAALDRDVYASWELDPGAPGHGYFVARLSTLPLADTGWPASLAVQFDWLLDGRPSDDVIGVLARWNDLRSRDASLEPLTCGLLLWPARRVDERYFGRLPTTYAELREFATAAGVALKTALDEARSIGAVVLGGVPITIAVLRPNTVLGTSSRIEWVSFLLVRDAAEPKPEDTVWALAHRRPLTPTFARELSAVVPPERVSRPLIIGCGAIGSKISLHLARAGVATQRLVDSATLTPHHLVRHGLHAEHLGKNKAEALREAIAAMYSQTAGTLGVQSIAGTAVDALAQRDAVIDRSVIIDATASSSVLRALASAELPEHVRVCRCEIADLGRLGLVSYEGHARNPRLDDLQAHAFDLARTVPSVREWLARHRQDDARQAALEDIGIGLGCSSATLRLSDDIVATHAAAAFRSLLRLGRNDDDPRGWLALVTLPLDGLATGETALVPVPPVTLVPVTNKEEWQVRIADQAMRTMRAALTRAAPAETGGLLVGYVHTKRRTAYITHALTASPDSIGTPHGFVRGTTDYMDEIDRIEDQTGGILGYIGEWHTHPRGSLAASPTDRGAMEELRRQLRGAFVPAHVIIVGRTGATAYLAD